MYVYIYIHNMKDSNHNECLREVEAGEVRADLNHGALHDLERPTGEVPSLELDELLVARFHVPHLGPHGIIQKYAAFRNVLTTQQLNTPSNSTHTKNAKSGDEDFLGGPQSPRAGGGRPLPAPGRRSRACGSSPG